jgi:hypothetical protein
MSSSLDLTLNGRIEGLVLLYYGWWFFPSTLFLFVRLFLKLAYPTFVTNPAMCYSDTGILEQNEAT